MTADSRAVEAKVHDLIKQRRFAEAEAVLGQVLASGTGPLTLWKQYAHALRGQGKAAEARPIQEMLVDHVPGDISSRFDLAETLLLLGEFERGWREYRYRYQLPHTARIERKVQKPRWSGAPMPGQTLLIHDEQGFGDTFQFMRMVRWAKARSQAKVVLEINAESRGLAERMGGFDALNVKGELPPPFDMHCEMMSLPMAIGLTLSDLPGQPMPYLTPDPERVNTWRKRLGELPRPLACLVWAGRPTHLNDAHRSIDLPMLAPLGASGCTFLSIQKGPSEGQAASPPEGLPLETLSPEIRDFEDTAAILSLADLLISVDSSPVHLAGALGRPAWVMLPFAPDWRWLQDREDTPWYPTHRLFRQRSDGDWQGVIARMAEALGQWRAARP